MPLKNNNRFGNLNNNNTDKFVQCDNKSTYEKNNSQVTDKNKRQDKSTHEKNNSRVNNKNKRPDNYGVVNRKVTVIGDSMITGVRKKKNRLIDNDQPNTKIYVKDHPGATVDDINSHIIPPLKRNSDLIIMHVGTNDLVSEKTPSEISNEIIELAKCTKHGSKEVVVSGIIPRRDKLNSKATEVNKLLQKGCQDHRVSFIDNSDFNRYKMLDARGLHLNDYGNNFFIEKLSRFIKF